MTVNPSVNDWEFGAKTGEKSALLLEVKQRNSGCWEGKFRKRGLTVNPSMGVNFTPGDFYVRA